MHAYQEYFDTVTVKQLQRYLDITHIDTCIVPTLSGSDPVHVRIIPYLLYVTCSVTSISWTV